MANLTSRDSHSPWIKFCRAGQQAPPDNNGVFDAGFGDPILSDNGTVATNASLDDTAGSYRDNTGLFRGDGGPINRVARAGQTVPEGNGQFEAISSPRLTSNGTTVFKGSLRNTPASADEALYRKPGGNGSSLDKIVRMDDTIEAEAGTFSTVTSVGAPAVNQSGEVAFTAGLDEGLGTDATVVRADGSGNFTQIVQVGDGVPGDSGTFSFLTSATPINSRGEVAFDAALQGDADRDEGIYRGDGSSLTRIAREGGSAPGGNGHFEFLKEPKLNDNSEVAFHSTLQNTANGDSDDTGIFIGSGSAVTEIARAGDPVPNGDGVFDSFQGFEVIDSGTVFFAAEIRNAEEGDYGLFLADGQQTIRVARDKGNVGELAAPDVATVDSPIGLPGRQTINDAGQAVFVAEHGDVPNEPDAGVFVYTPQLNWRAEGSGDWDNTANWTVGLSPSQTTNVTIDSDNAVTVDGPTAATTVKTLQVGGGSGETTLALTAGRITADEGTTVESTGRIAVEGSSATTFSGPLHNFGHIDVDDEASAVFTHKVTGTGGFTGDGEIVFKDEFSPGASPGTVTISPDVTFDVGSKITIEIAGLNAGTNHDQITFEGDVTLSDVDLELVLLDATGSSEPFEPEAGDQFNILNYDSAPDGTFEQINRPQLDSNLSWELTDLESTGTISVVPEPTSATMLGLALTLLIGFRRRLS